MKLIYIMDPMCSWCWAFRQPLQEFRENHAELPIELIMGGLAADSQDPMPIEMQQKLQQIWQHIEQQTQTPFNYDFWRNNSPRRSTYPACRAVISAEAIGGPKAQYEMVELIQQAYYQRALNPSDNAILVQLAEELGLDSVEFARLLSSPEIEVKLRADLAKAGDYGVGGFPALLVDTGSESGNRVVPLALGYTSADKLEQRYLQLSNS